MEENFRRKTLDELQKYYPQQQQFGVSYKKLLLKVFMKNVKIVVFADINMFSPARIYLAFAL